MIYRLLRALLRHALRIFFRKLEIEGLEDVPEQGPLLLAANHPNTLIDVLLVATCLDRKVGFVAKSTLFKNPLIGALLRFLGAVPIYRRKDGPLTEATRDQNKSALAGCEQAVADGQAILIFPEGVSEPNPRLQPLKTGLARIALGAEERAPGQVVIVPVALVYDDMETFRSRARVKFLPRIQVAPYRNLSGGDEFGPARALTEAVRGELVGEVLHIEDETHGPFVRDLDLVYGHAVSDQAGSRLEATNVIANAVNHFARTDPARIERGRALLSQYKGALEAAGVDDDVVRHARERTSPARNLLYLLSLPLMLWGVVNHLVLYHFPRLMLRLVPPSDATETSTLKLLSGLLMLGISYTVQGWLVFWLARTYPELTPQIAGTRTPWTPTLLYLGTLPPCGVVALLWIDGFQSDRQRARARGERGRLDAGTLMELAEKREALTSLLDTARADYLAATSELALEPGEPGDPW